MAIVVYKCDICKRTIELQRDIEGLERIHRCTITHGCRGKLFQTDVLEDYIRGGLPDDVSGLENWIQRKVLHNHEQAIERDEWIITHNMGAYPITNVWVDRPIEDDLGNREEITPEDIVIVDDNTLLLRFDRPWSGIAQLIGRQSDPDLLIPIVREVEEVAAPAQISNNGEITIATRLDDVSVDLVTQYSTANEINPTITYAADDQPSLDSAWVDFNKVVIQGKIYTVRSFNGIVTEISSGVINSGSTFRFTKIEGLDIQPNEILILLASTPFELVDKQRDRFIDVTDVTATSNQFALYYNSGEFFAEDQIIQNVYPLIRPI